MRTTAKACREASGSFDCINVGVICGDPSTAREPDRGGDKTWIRDAGQKDQIDIDERAFRRPLLLDRHVRRHNTFVEMMVVESSFHGCGDFVENKRSGSEATALSSFQNSIQNHAFLGLVRIDDVSTKATDGRSYQPRTLAITPRQQMCECTRYARLPSTTRNEESDNVAA
jgi:hypothetical protein